MEIVSGRTGSPHVTSQQFRQILEGIVGSGSCVLPSGENLEPELASNYICNEALSLLENAAVFVPIPEKLKDVLLQLRDKEIDRDSEGE